MVIILFGRVNMSILTLRPMIGAVRPMPTFVQEEL